MQNKIIRLTVFFLILLLLVSVSSIFFQERILPSDPAIFLEPEDSIDVLFIGDSLMRYGVSSMSIWQEYGIPTYNCSTTAQRTYRTVDQLRQALLHQSPKVVILEAHVLYVEHNWNEAFVTNIGTVFPLMRNHDSWKPVSLQNWFAPSVTCTPDLLKGCGFSRKIEPADATEYGTDSYEAEPVPEKNIAYAKRIQKLCQENGAQLVLIQIPSALDWNWNMARHYAVAQLAEELDVPFLDLNLERDEIPIDWEIDTLDAGDHLNLTGMAKTSSFIGKYLSETFELPDKRTLPQYDSWNQDAETYFQLVSAGFDFVVRKN